VFASLLTAALLGTANITFDEIARIFGSLSGQSAITTWSSMHITSSTTISWCSAGQSGSAGTEDTINNVSPGAGSPVGQSNNSNITRETSQRITY